MPFDFVGSSPLVRVMAWKVMIIGSAAGSIIATIITVMRAKNNPNPSGPIRSEGDIMIDMKGSDVFQVRNQAAPVTKMMTSPVGAASWRVMFKAVN